jgi:hypothetical protein
MKQSQHFFADLGAQQVKNIQDPVRAYQAYQVGAPIEADARSPNEKPRSRAGA